MIPIAIVVIAVGFLIGLLIAEYGQKQWLVLAFKTPLSCLFVLTAVLQTPSHQVYYYCVLVGLIFGLVGDVFLALPGRRAFLTGLVAFLLGHLMYVGAFGSLARPAEWVTAVPLLFVAVTVAVFLWLRSSLGSMLIPVLAYCIIITVMVSAAWVAFRNPTIQPAGAWALLVGAVAFYLSDLFVARERFMTSSFVNRLVGLPLYYLGQFLLAISVGQLGQV